MSTTTESLRFAPDILKRLGEELVPHPDRGIIELVRNSYDADAGRCVVELSGTMSKGGTVRIVDDGIGMDVDDIKSGWLVIGRSRKAERKRTARQRLQVGDKGLGRLAALRLGGNAELLTRPKREPGVEYRVAIDWSKYDKATLVEDVQLNITRHPTTSKPGTEITIRDLNVKFGRRETQRLARQLLLLADPFSRQGGFRAELLAKDFEDLERRVRESYFDLAEFHLTARLQNGKGKAEVRNSKGKILWKAEHGDLTDSAAYETAPLLFELWAFLLDAKKFSDKSMSLGEMRDWLEVVGGVHIYHRGLRVYPYGDPGHDWLDLNLARARSPESRPSTNNSLGRVVVEDPDDRLLEKTDRSGFVENDAFREVQRFATDALDWMATRRLEHAERVRQSRTTDANTGRERAKQQIKQALNRVDPIIKPVLEKAVGRLERVHEFETSALRDEVQLYRTLATIGTTASVFAHDAAKPITQIEKLTSVVADRVRKEVGEERYELKLREPLDVLSRSAHALRSFAALPLHFLDRRKRRAGKVDVRDTIDGLLRLFQPYLADARIEVKVRAESGIVIKGSVAALESVLANLITNAINAFNSSGKPGGTRLIDIQAAVDKTQLTLRISDNGPGIKNIKLDEIWLPGKTTTTGGTGLGLTIVRDTVSDLGGQVEAKPRGRIGGAEFLITLPRAA